MLWVTDADNTLWDTDSVYRAAQLRLLRDTEDAIGVRSNVDDPLAYLRAIDEGLARRDHRGLNYPPSMLVEGLARRLRGQPLDRAVARSSQAASLREDVRQAIVARFQTNLMAWPQLRPGVREGLTRLGEAGAKVVVITEGQQDRIERSIAHHECGDVLRSVIAAKKTEALFARVLQMRPDRAPWAIGDQLDKDVLPAQATGFNVILFPGSFRPSWNAREREDGGVTRVSNYLDAVETALSQSYCAKV